MQFTLLAFIFFTTIHASRIADLIYRKYNSEINPPSRQIIHKNSNGKDQIINIPGMTRIFTMALKEPENRALLENFENDPEAVLTNRYLKAYLIYHVARDYEADSLSREIFNRCLSLGLGMEYIHNILIAAVKTNSVTLIEKLISEYGTNTYDYYQAYSYHGQEFFVEALISNGRLDLAKRLFLEGKLSINPGSLAASLCSLTHPKYTRELISFLDLLIVQLGLFDINKPIMAYSSKTHSNTLLHILLHRNNNSQSIHKMIETVATYLINIGADPDVRCLQKRSAYEIAELKGFNLPSKTFFQDK